MIEWLILLGVCYLMVLIASGDNQSPVLWGFVTFIVCIVMAMFIPIPFIRIFAGGAASFVLMIGYKAAFNK